ncbi:hypothetical protein FRB96_007775 [Tulasnella sp. 330]|nr:hypothetical protein FRB96_007775 [Tulasnella sp. 330]
MVIGVASQQGDASKPPAQAWIQKDVQLREVDISPGKEADMVKAFEGAGIVSAVTNAIELGTKEKEVAQGNLSERI